MHPGLILIFALLAVLITYIIGWMIYSPHAGRFRSVAHTFVRFLLIPELIIVAVAIFTWACCSDHKTSNTETSTKEVSIVSVFASTTVNGKGDFSWGNGSFVVSTNDVYQYYYTTPEGIKQGKVPTNKTVINFTEDEPVLRITTAVTTDNYSWWGPFHLETTTEDKKYEFLIPQSYVLSQSNNS